MVAKKENNERFDELMDKITRPGKERFIGWLRDSTDFFTAPASSRYHLACEGGLLQHSLNVYECLVAKRSDPIWEDALKDIPEESFIIMALFHDLCKANFYIKGSKNQKSYDHEKVMAAEPRQRKHDDLGDFVWETVLKYEIDDKLPLGHGEKSVILLSGFMKLSCQEAMAIRWHMGYSEDRSQYNVLGEAMSKFPVVLALNEADLEASKLLEDIDGNKRTALKETPVS